MTYRVHLDFETRSLIDLRTRGDQMYAQDASTSPLMLAVITPHVKGVVDFFEDINYRNSVYPAQKLEAANLYRYPCPQTLIKAIQDDAVFVAHNARFEQSIYYWICHKRWGWPMPRRWSCTAARARYWGLRASLAGLGSDLEIEQQKHAEAGDTFIKTFCIPRAFKGAKKNGIVTKLWLEPHEDRPGWLRGKEYCLRDAEAEAEIDAILPDLPPFEQAVWELDLKMNIRGLPIDSDNVLKAIHFSDHYNQIGQLRFNALTGLNPTQRDRVLEYLNSREEIEKLPDLRTKTLQRMNMADFPPDLHDVINIRIEAARASVKKLEAMANGTSPDGNARGLFLYYGAHTGRVTAKRIQPHNYIRGDETVKAIIFDYFNNPCWDAGLNQATRNPVWIDTADMLFPRPLGALSKAMRGFIKAPSGEQFVIGDYAQIECRVLAWLARCMSLLESFKAKEDVYVRFAADHMYSRDYSLYFGSNGKVRPEFRHERQISKSAVLGCGYGLGAPGFQQYCDASDIIISLEEAQSTIKTYREAYPEIADWQSGLWKRTQICATQAVAQEGSIQQLWGTDVSFHVHRLTEERYWLICTLPSGRHIAYYRPKLDDVDKWGRPVLSYRNEWNGKTQRETTYGGKLVENIVQAIARDICMLGALKAEEAGFAMIGTVHDELITRVRAGDNYLTAETMREVMIVKEPWMTDLPLEAEAVEMARYGSH